MKQKNRSLLIAIIVLILIFLGLAIFYIWYLNNAHSTFENYYNFRGCVSLLNKTEDYGFCKLQSGDTIKLVKYQGKWFLDGDLPVKCFWIINCP